MRVTHLNIEEFRSIRALGIEVPSGGFGLFGANAAGKSSLLEAVAMLATTRSPRATNDREVINWGSGEEIATSPYSRVEASIETAAGPHQIQIGMQLDPAGGRIRKLIMVDDRKRRSSTAIGVLKAVLFEPTDIDLVSGSPSNRRRFLDIHLSQVDHAYLQSLSRYHRIVEQRNSLLKSMQREGGDLTSDRVASQLEFWNTELVAHGSQVVARRIHAVHQLQQLAARLLAEFTDNLKLTVTYVSSTGAQPLIDRLAPGDELDPDEVGFAMQSELERRRRDELRRGVTLIGPHRDDFTAMLDGVEVGTYGSRGQQRLTAVALKLAEAELMLQESGERPIVLLDDILSELDPNHRTLLTASLSNLGSQVIVTATERALLDTAGLNMDAIAEISQGSFQWVGSNSQ